MINQALYMYLFGRTNMCTVSSMCKSNQYFLSGENQKRIQTEEEPDGWIFLGMKIKNKLYK